RNLRREMLMLTPVRELITIIETTAHRTTIQSRVDDARKSNPPGRVSVRLDQIRHGRSPAAGRRADGCGNEGARGQALRRRARRVPPGGRKRSKGLCGSFPPGAILQSFEKRF